MSAVSVRAVDVVYSRDDEGVRTYVVTYEVITDSLSDHAQIAWLAVANQAPFGTPYLFGNDSDPWCFARWPSAARLRSVDKSRRVWRVDLAFTNRPVGKSCSQSEIDNPLSQPPKIGGSYLSRTKAATQDRFGAPITNSSDEPVVPAPEIDDPRDTVTIEVNTASIDLALRSRFRNKCNAAVLWGLPARTVRLGQWSYSLEYYGSCTRYVANKLEFEIDLDQWDFVYIDQGFRTVTGSFEIVPGKTVTLYKTEMDDRDPPLRLPRLLDGHGQLLDAADDPVLLRREIVHQDDFSLLPIPNPLF